MKYRYYTCDVFTETRFGGNQLSVLPDAKGLSTTSMQNIAREFNYAETTFVLPAEKGHTRRVRIFTPLREVPFAGHPNIGTAFTLATTGEVEPNSVVTFEEEAGIVPVAIRETADGSISCELCAPQPLQLGKSTEAEVLARVLSLELSDIVTTNHQPQEASVGLPFLMVEVKTRDALARARIDIDELRVLESSGFSPDIHVYVFGSGDCDLHARMFAPMDGVPEDAATGSANCALVAMLAQMKDSPDGEFSWRIAQGEDMGRHSRLMGRSHKENGRVTDSWIGGSCVMVCEGWIECS